MSFFISVEIFFVLCAIKTAIADNSKREDTLRCARRLFGTRSLVPPTTKIGRFRQGDRSFLYHKHHIQLNFLKNFNFVEIFLTLCDNTFQRDLSKNEFFYKNRITQKLGGTTI